MGADLVVKVHYGAWLWQPLAKGKGVHREVKSEGSRRQILALRNTNRIRHVHLDESATQGKVLYNQKVRMYMRQRHERKVSILTQGDLSIRLGQPRRKRRAESSEVSRGHSIAATREGLNIKQRYSVERLGVHTSTAAIFARSLRHHEPGDTRRTASRA